ncbi:putative transcription factor WD40-like family [Helianthus debilis subsp. tardiflorus]
MLWNVASKALVLSYDSGGHARNVRLGQVADNGNLQTIELGKHNGRVHKLAVQPGSPHMFYSCGEDEFVQRFDLRSNSSTKLFCCSTFTGTDNLFSSNILSLNSIIIDPRHPNYFYLGDCDQYARVYDSGGLRNFSMGVRNFFKNFRPRGI